MVVRTVSTFLATAAILVAIAATAARAGNAPVLPFEAVSEVPVPKSQRLRFDDYAGLIPDSRIKRLLRSGPILGDRVLLQNNVAVYFPDGHIVSSKVEFHSYRPVGDLMAWNVHYRREIEPDPRYALVAKLDELVGPVCAETPYLRGLARRDEDARESFARLRISGDGVITYEIESPGLYDYLTKEVSRSFTLTSALDTYYLGDPEIVQTLLAECRSQRGVRKAEVSDR